MGNGKKVFKALQQLARHIRDRHPLLEANIHRTSFHNPWFEKPNYWQSLDAIADFMLDRDELSKWCSNYQFPVGKEFRKIVGLIFAGNIPLVGFQDFLSVYLSGHEAEIKLSGKDPYVFPAVLKLLSETDPDIIERFRLVEKLQNHEAAIATGSGNTNRYFRKYFGDYPSILRSNRTSLAILDGSESSAELEALTHDIFDYFGLGCRNVTKLFVPEDYDFESFLMAMKPFDRVMNNMKYKNNYDYNLSIELLNRSHIISTDFVLLKRVHEGFASPVGMIFYDEYNDVELLTGALADHKHELQTVVGNYEVEGVARTDFGKTQQPGLFDYPDGEDLGHFLFEITCKIDS